MDSSLCLLSCEMLSITGGGSLAVDGKLYSILSGTAIHVLSFLCTDWRRWQNCAVVQSNPYYIKAQVS